MSSVQLRIPPFFACMIHPGTADWLIFEKEIGDATTVGDILTDLASKNHSFCERIFNPVAGTVSDQVDIVLNQKLLHFPGETDTRLNDGDVVILIPVYTGG
ncbi:MAG: MoaD/ThiS family protein [Chloroflexota bacterium]